MKRFIAALVLLLTVDAVHGRTLLTAPTTFYTSPSGADAAGCGTSASPCLTMNYLYGSVIQPGYDLGCQRVTIMRRTSATPPDVYSDSFTAVGNVVGGDCGTALVANGTDTVTPPQIAIVGDPTTPANVIWRPASGEAAMSVQWGARFYVEGVTFEGDNSAFTGEMLVGTTSAGYLGLGNNVFGCNPGKIDIQPSVSSDVVVFAGYTVDQTQCGGSALSPVNTDASVSSGSNQMGLSSPAGVAACIAAGNCVISAANVPTGTKAVSLSGAWVTMSANATGSSGFEPVTLAQGLSGCTKAHDQQDAWSQFQVLSGLQITLKNTPCYNGGSGFLMLDDAQAYIQGVTWKGTPSLQNGTTAVWRNTSPRNGYLFNNGSNAPQDNTLVFTP